MGNTITMPTQGQLLVDVEDMSMMNEIKRAIKLLRGVKRVTIPRGKRLTAYERSLRDLDEGRVFEAKDVNDLFEQILN